MRTDVPFIPPDMSVEHAWQWALERDGAGVPGRARATGWSASVTREQLGRLEAIGTGPATPSSSVVD